MMRTVKAYAKINLFLEVTGLLQNGYHSVNTVMQSISLCDEVTVDLLEEKKIFSESDSPELPSDDKNIAVRAARLYLDAVGADCGARISIKKNIPLAAGLAGGSADAAATLIALNSLFEDALSLDALCALGAKLGADIPFCIVCGTSFADSKGDVLHECPELSAPVALVVGCAGEGVSTPWAYRLLDSYFDNFESYSPHSHERIVSSLENESGIDFYKHIYNIFEKPVIEQRPAVKRIKDIMQENSALATLMSGSGPSVYGVFEDVGSAEKACCALREDGCFAAVAFFVKKRF